MQHCKKLIVERNKTLLNIWSIKFISALNILSNYCLLKLDWKRQCEWQDTNVCMRVGGELDDASHVERGGGVGKYTVLCPCVRSKRSRDGSASHDRPSHNTHLQKIRQVAGLTFSCVRLPSTPWSKQKATKTLVQPTQTQMCFKALTFLAALLFSAHIGLWGFVERGSGGGGGGVSFWKWKQYEGTG